MPHTNSKHSWKKLALMAFSVFLLSACTLSFFTIWLDHTNYGTQNGLWKSVELKNYIEHGVDYKNPPDLSYFTNLLYFPVYATIIEHWHPAFETTTIQKMSLANAWIGSLTLGIFFLMTFMITQSMFASVVASLFHLSCGTFISVTTGSEDIIPAYFFFVGATFLFLLYLKHGGIKWLILSALFYGFSWLFHWTMAVGPAPAIAVALLVFHGKRKIAVRDILIFAGINFIVLFVASKISGADILNLLMPGKSMDSGYLGFTTDKFMLLYTGFALYILGGFQFNGIEQVWEQLFVFNWYQKAFIASSIILIALAVFSMKYFMKHRNEKWHSAFGIYLALTFLVAQIMNAYEFGTDLQFHLQPMIWLPVAYGMFSNQVLNKKMISFLSEKINAYLLSAVLILIPVGLFSYNILYFRLTDKGLDSFFLNTIKNVEPYFKNNLNNTLFVTRGWDEFGNWAHAEWGRDYKENCIRVTDFLEYAPNETIKQATSRFEKIITTEIGNGKLVVTGPEIIDRNEEEMVNIFSGFGQNEKAYALIHTVKEKFQREVYVKTEMGTIYRLSLKQD